MKYHCLWPYETCEGFTSLPCYMMLRISNMAHWGINWGPKCTIMVIRVNFFQTELMVEICSKSLVRAVCQILLMKFS